MAQHHCNRLASTRIQGKAAHIRIDAYGYMDTGESHLADAERRRCCEDTNELLGSWIFLWRFYLFGHLERNWSLRTAIRTATKTRLNKQTTSKTDDNSPQGPQDREDMKTSSESEVGKRKMHTSTALKPTRNDPAEQPNPPEYQSLKLVYPS